MTQIISVFKGQKEFQRKLARASKDLTNFSRIHNRIGVNVLKWIDKNFRDEGTEKKWPGLADSTKFARRKKSGKILQDTGLHLKNTFTQDASEFQVKIGTPTKWAGVHEKGGKGDYLITPKKGKLLAFFHPQGNQQVKLKGRTLLGIKTDAVIHPPAKQRKMLPSEKAAQRITSETAAKFIESEINKNFGK